MTDNNNTKDDRNKLSAVWNAEPDGIGLDDKITIIENWSYEALKYLPPWIMPEAIESDGYYFAAHSREDFKIVYTDILRLESVGVDIWYDRAMEPSKDWRELAKRMMNRQTGVQGRHRLRHGELHGEQAGADRTARRR